MVRMTFTDMCACNKMYWNYGYYYFQRCHYCWAVYYYLFIYCL